jgi:diguanylate cyclase (GGDEF)-like protein
VVGIGGYLTNTQAAAKTKLHDDFADRAGLTADLTGGVLTSSDAKTRDFAEMSYAGPAAGMKTAIRTDHTGVDWVVVLRADGTVLGADPPSFAAQAERMVTDPGFVLAIKRGQLSFGDVVTGANGGSVEGFQPYSAPDGPRMFVMSIRVAEVATLLSNTLQVANARTYVVDGHGKVIASSAGEPAGQSVSGQSLAAALRTSGSGTVNGQYHVSAAVPGSNWRVIFTTAESSLMAPVQSTRRLAWELFGAFAGAMILLIAIGATALIGSARLAHARLHDTLTGLPNRSLFIDETQRAISERKNGPVAALFIDLDGFKPINDTYGHTVGDAVLKAVSQRLLESMRPGDYVSRFGGDEFLVLCKGLRLEADAAAVAERIQKYIAEPFEIDGNTVSVGTSIGIALVGDHADHAEALIHNADLAMYRAKQAGRGCVEQFTPEMAQSDA